jgi:hypothetical protein
VLEGSSGSGDWKPLFPQKGEADLSKGCVDGYRIFPYAPSVTKNAVFNLTEIVSYTSKISFRI